MADNLNNNIYSAVVCLHVQQHTRKIFINNLFTYHGRFTSQTMVEELSVYKEGSRFHSIVS